MRIHFLKLIGDHFTDVYGGPAKEFQADIENGADKCAVNVQNV